MSFCAIAGVVIGDTRDAVKKNENEKEVRSMNS
jgi:hypothetical protein